MEALIQTAGVPHVEMQEELRIHVPLSVDFRLQKETEDSTSDGDLGEIWEKYQNWLVVWLPFFDFSH